MKDGPGREPSFLLHGFDERADEHETEYLLRPLPYDPAGEIPAVGFPGKEEWGIREDGIDELQENVEDVIR